MKKLVELEENGEQIKKPNMRTKSKIRSDWDYIEQALRSKFLVTAKGWYWQTL